MMFTLTAAFVMITIMMFIYVSGNEESRPIAGFNFDFDDEKDNNLLMTVIVSFVVIALVVILW